MPQLFRLTTADRPRADLASRHLPLSEPVFQILLSVADQDLHGYAVIQDIRARTAGEVELTASTLYAAVKRLLEAQPPDAPRQRGASAPPILLPPPAALDGLAHVTEHLVGDVERRLGWPAEVLLGACDLVLAERAPVRLRRARLVPGEP